MNYEDIKIIEELCKKYNLLEKQGYVNTDIDEIDIFKISKDEKMMPLLFNKGFVFLAKGKKITYIKNDLVDNTKNHYGIIATPQPIECETCVLSEDSVIGIYINLNMKRLYKIVSKYNKLSKYSFTDQKTLNSVSINKKTDKINNVLSRILFALQDDMESSLLMSYLLDELYFRILQDKSGDILQQLCEQSSSFSKITNIIEFIHNNYNEKISIDEMAEMAEMSINSFHRLFKKATNDTPIQFIKKIRLGRARELILHKNMKSIEASEKVGYDSVTQFSREFKRYYGVTPGKISELGYITF